MTGKRISPLFQAILAMLAVAALCAQAAQAQGVADFYKGKTIHVSVGTSPGGVNDITARLVSRHLGKHIPGNPAITVQNLPGAGGIVGANRIANTASKDGLELAIMERAVPQVAFAGDPNARFDPMTLTWLGSVSSYADDAYMFLVMANHPAKTAEDLRKPDVRAVMGANRIGSTNLTFAWIAERVLKLNVKAIPGYRGAAKIAVSMQSGEVDGQIIGLASFQAGQRAMWEKKQVRALIQFGRLTRHPQLPEVPTGRELATDAKAKALLEFAELPFFMALPFVAPPGIPADRAAALRSAFMATTKDPAFLAEASKLRLDVSPIDHNRILELLQEAKKAPPEVLSQFLALITKPKKT
ncbi:MAG: Bug family tripartite tricarboxylate transporter substrate binding protein [Beijerinckiaceae bacterium]